MQSGSLVGSDVMAYTSRVLVNGIERKADSWSVGRELSGDLPEQVAAVVGVMQATGSVTWADQPDVSTASANPWNSSSGWLPAKGDRVVIYAGDGVSEWMQFTGRVDETTGAVGSSPQSTLVDDVDKLSARFSHQAMIRVMPPLARGGDRMNVGLTHMYYVDAALRVSGFYATPPTEVRTILSVPAQSSMWPEVGGMTQGPPDGVDGGPWCTPYNGPDGLAIADVLNFYAPALKFPMTERVRFSMTVSPDHAGNTTMKAYYGATDYVELAVAGSRTVIARLNGVDVCSLVMGTAVRVSLHILGGVWTLRTNTGTTASGTATNPTTAVLDRIIITADGNSRVAGFHAVHPDSSTAYKYTEFVPSSRYRFEIMGTLGLMDAGRVIEPTTARDLLEAIGKATLAAMWIDEHGVMQWVPSNGLVEQASMQTVTTFDDIRSLAWKDSLLGARRSVVGEYDIPAISSSRWDNVLWHQGSAETLESGQVRNEFLSPGADEDWIGPSPSYLTLGAEGSGAAVNGGWGHVTGAVLTDGTTEEAGEPYLTSTFERVNVNAWKNTHSAGSLPLGKKLELRYPSASASIWSRWLKQAFPLIRGFAKVDWAKQESKSTVALGPDYAPVLTHALGHWLSRESNDQAVINYVLDAIAVQTSAPAPVITGMEVGYDPRRQLGDVITIGSPQLLGVYMKTLVVGVSGGESDGYSQTLTVRVLTVGTSYTTFAEYNKALGENALTFQQWQALGPLPQTYEQFNDAA